MAIEFNRIITLLRKERGITQKQAAQELGISQAQLSHYEKGIRECSLAFVVQVADYYGVSCDYLLGRSAERSGQTIRVEFYHHIRDEVRFDSLDALKAQITADADTTRRYFAAQP